MDIKLVNRIEDMHRSIKQTPMLCVLSLLLPIMLPLTAAAALMCLMSRSRLLRALTATAFEPRSAADMVLAMKVDYIRRNAPTLYFPIILLFLIVGGVAALIIMSEAGVRFA